jgi:hypothetical protein
MTTATGINIVWADVDSLIDSVGDGSSFVEVITLKLMEADEFTSYVG